MLIVLAGMLTSGFDAGPGLSGLGASLAGLVTLVRDLRATVAVGEGSSVLVGSSSGLEIGSLVDETARRVAPLGQQGRRL